MRPDLADHPRRGVEPLQRAGVEDLLDRAQQVVVIVRREGDAAGAHARAEERAVDAVRTGGTSLVEEDDEEQPGGEVRVGEERVETRAEAGSGDGDRGLVAVASEV